MIYWNDVGIIPIMQSILDHDRIILASGDTVLGLWGKLSEKAYDELGRLKKRTNKPYLVVISSHEKLEKFIDQSLSLKIQTLISVCWPGPVTLVFKARSDLPDWMKSEKGTIAIRMPDHPMLQRLLGKYDGLFSTSANISGDPIPGSINEIDHRISHNVSLRCFDRDKEQSFSLGSSTILDCSTDDIVLLRKGAFYSQALQDLVE